MDLPSSTIIQCLNTFGKVHNQKTIYPAKLAYVLL